ncbi:hypothetical protein [Streptomyces olivochromogenes]|uniref:hypothetical protein n=1 Tax=Streptomyces olivochromogenes TaxID=1963 RepID=UPI0036C4B12E
MTDDLTPREQAARAVVDFDRAVHDPNRDVDPVALLFRSLGAVMDQHAQEMRASKVRWRNRPEAKARRSASVRKAAATRAANKAAERAAELAEWERDARVPAVHCPHFDYVRDAVETTCIGEPGHRGDHEDLDGHTWPNECDGTCEDFCDC